MTTVKGLGLVEEAIDVNALISSSIAIGHVRYSTTGKGDINEAQPFGDDKLTIAFNGTIPNYIYYKVSTDTEFIYRVLSEEEDVKKGIRKFVEIADGGYSLVVLTSRGEIIALRDSKGIRPLVIGKLGSGYIIASEDSAIRQLGGNVIRSVKPGEMIYIKDGKIESEIIARGETHFCSFEYIYFARTDSIIDGISVYEARVRLGEILAERHGVHADVVVPVPESSIPIALGFSKRSGIPLEYGIIRTMASKRSFIMPTMDKRENVIEDKFGIVRKAIEGKRIVLIDDSIVRGTTMRKLINMLREGGAREVHVRVGSPMVKYPCYMGIDFPTREELIANGKDEDEIAKAIGADSVEYLTLDEMVRAIGRKDLCHACFSGIYPLKHSYNFSISNIRIRR